VIPAMVRSGVKRSPPSKGGCDQTMPAAPRKVPSFSLGAIRGTMVPQGCGSSSQDGGVGVFVTR
jgi:hypothetical protein